MEFKGYYTAGTYDGAVKKFYEELGKAGLCCQAFGCKISQNGADYDMIFYFEATVSPVH